MGNGLVDHCQTADRALAAAGAQHQDVTHPVVTTTTLNEVYPDAKRTPLV